MPQMLPMLLAKQSEQVHRSEAASQLQELRSARVRELALPLHRAHAARWARARRGTRWEAREDTATL